MPLVVTIIFTAENFMSEVAALVPFGESHSALFYRDLFLHDETRYEPFWCPFCGVKLFPVLVYEPVDAELAKSPHFRRSEAHRHGCDGNPAQAKKPRGASEPAWKVEKQPFILPTRLVDYVEPPPRIARIQPAPTPTAAEVQKRRTEAGTDHHRTRFSVALVQSVAEAHLGMISHAYQQQKEKKWSDRQRRDWLSRVFDAEIDLRGSTMKYKEALQDLYFPLRSTPRVYYSEGTVTTVEDGYVISAARPARTSDEDKDGRLFNVTVRFDGDPAGLRGARRELLAQLQRAAEHGFLVRWYAYGLPERNAEWIELRFDANNLSDLFVRRKPGGVPAKRPASRQKSVVDMRAGVEPSARTRDVSPATNDVTGAFIAPRAVGHKRPIPVPVLEQALSGGKPGLPAPLTSLTVESTSQPMLSPQIEDDSRQIALNEATEQEYEAYLAELIDAARSNLTDFRKLKLEPHVRRRPLLWGRSAWKATLSELEEIDRRNSERLRRLMRRELTQDEIAHVKEEAVKRRS
ncbi:hypothetical protein [Burkholderia pseudomallei]|uniref:hypothetical protein n=1 Tax=Burkholderia pseudomallei TaxID=28450 RepID=UPI001178B63E|nr:hypothetical protein [Burkholderia pseudomallei]